MLQIEHSPAGKSTRPSVHIIGIGGIGMSALARWFLSQNWAVSGSDLTRSPITEELRKEGIRVKIGLHKATSLPRKAGLVIYSQAVTLKNPERAAAHVHGIQTYSYPEMVGILTREHDTIAVSGAHGKSTTTALIGLTLMRAKFDPTIVIGTKLRELGGKNFRAGKSRYLVLEADEYGRAFHHYSPFITVVTNIDAEHLDTYKNLAGVKRGFLRYFENIREGGCFVLNKDDKNLYSLKPQIERTAAARHSRIVWYSLRDRAAARIERIMKIPGSHNVSNALAAAATGEALRIPLSTMLASLARYRGSWRRFEYRGELRLPSPRGTARAEKPRASIYDDYAHHPTEIRATLKGFKEKFPKHRIICVFQPHQARRLEALFKEFQHAFDLADTTLILPIYAVAGRDEKHHARFNSKTLVTAIQRREPNKAIFYLENPKNLRAALTTLLTTPVVCGPGENGASPRSSSVIIMMGAGNVVEYTESLL